MTIHKNPSEQGLHAALEQAKEKSISLVSGFNEKIFIVTMFNLIIPIKQHGKK